MERLGLAPTKNSGSGWVEKEDGQNEYVICQLKSTDAQSIKVSQKDIRILEDNAAVSHKIPVFAIQFLNTGEVFLMCRPSDMKSLAEYLETGETRKAESLLDMDESKSIEEVSFMLRKKKISSSPDDRESFHQDRENYYRKENKANGKRNNS